VGIYTKDIKLRDNILKKVVMNPSFKTIVRDYKTKITRSDYNRFLNMDSDFIDTEELNAYI
jgi:hypothetical protein